MGNFDQDFTR